MKHQNIQRKQPFTHNLLHSVSREKKEYNDFDILFSVQLHFGLFVMQCNIALYRNIYHCNLFTEFFLSYLKNWNHKK